MCRARTATSVRAPEVLALSACLLDASNEAPCPLFCALVCSSLTASTTVASAIASAEPGCFLFARAAFFCSARFFAASDGMARARPATR